MQFAPRASRVEETEDRLGGGRIAAKYPFDRPHVVGLIRSSQRAVGGVCVNGAARRVGNDNAVTRPVDDSFEHRVAGIVAADSENTSRSREQSKHPDRGEDGEQNHDVGFGAALAHKGKPDGGRNQGGGHQQHQKDATPAAGAVDSARMLLAQVLRRHGPESCSDFLMNERREVRKSYPEANLRMTSAFRSLDRAGARSAHRARCGLTFACNRRLCRPKRRAISMISGVREKQHGMIF